VLSKINYGGTMAEISGDFEAYHHNMAMAM